MFISPKRNASGRTKNRLREHGPQFSILTEAKACRFDNGQELWVLVENDTWTGWLPENEINIVFSLDS